MIVPAALFHKLPSSNELHKGTPRANRPDAFEIEKTRPIYEHFVLAATGGNNWRDRGREAYIERPGYVPSPVLERQAVLMHHAENHDLELLKADIATRLRAACAHFSEHDFAELVHRIASIELKYGRNALGPPPTRT